MKVLNKKSILEWLCLSLLALCIRPSFAAPSNNKTELSNTPTQTAPAASGTAASGTAASGSVASGNAASDLAESLAKPQTKAGSASSSSDKSANSENPEKPEAKPKPSAAADPIVMLQGVTNRVLGAIKTNRQSLENNPGRLYSLVDSLIIPYADFTEMARWVAGRNAWNAADKSTQNQFVKALQTLVVRTYARSLLAYKDQTIEFLPLRESTGNKQRVKVMSIIHEQNGEAVRMDYNLIRHDDDWRVYDIIIEGVSLVQGYRAQLADDIRQSGLKGGLDRLNAHNESR